MRDKPAGESGQRDGGAGGRCLDRRAFLRSAALAGAVPSSLPGWMAAPRRLRLESARTGEVLAAQYWQGGLYQADELARIDRFLSDWRTGEVVQVAVSLLDILWRLQLAVRFTVPVLVLSGFRSRQTNALLRRVYGEGVAEHSFHIRAMAADIRLPGIPSATVAGFARGLALGGVGYYPASDFVHIDSGPARSWFG